tara:strand:+ start:411 stop:641 length:231 start_codon:yes stop_codon:yes gene_type:complete
MRLTEKQTGISFNLTPKESADFFYMKNKDGQFINNFDEYIIQDPKSEISTFKFFLGCLAMLILCYACFYLFLQFNY